MDATTPEAQKPPPRRSALRSLLRIGLALSAVLLLALMAGLGYLLISYPGQPGPGRGRLVEVEIVQGASLEDVAARLATGGALREPVLFALYGRIRGAGPRLHAGRTILVYDDMEPRELLQRIASGFGSAELRVVIPEGFSRFEIAARLERFGICERGAFLQATEEKELLRELTIDGPTAEGFLFPDTYQLREGMAATQVVRRFVANARKRTAKMLTMHEAALGALRAELGFRAHEVLTLASIVEKEARLPSEQPIIAGVFLNRLRDPSFRPKRLQADPTVTYGCLIMPELPSCAGANAGQAPTRAMLADPANPYNTYRHEGLPPGPIANPGLSAIEAVIRPAPHDYLYFVAQGGGAHTFSRSLQDHNVAVDQLRAP